MPKKCLVVSAPARICLFGEHQDYLQLPVIACAINLRMFVEGNRKNNSFFSVALPDIYRHISLNPNENLKYESKRDYLKSAINILKRKGLTFRNGYELTISSKIPINSGLSSSSAMIVSWLYFLLESQMPDSCNEKHISYSLEDLAEFAYEAEVAEFKEAGGKMDHYTLALGNTLFIEPREKVKVERLRDLEGFVIGDSLEEKKTIDVLKNLRKEVSEGLETLERFGYDRHLSDSYEIDLSILPCSSQNKIWATLINRDITTRARDILRKQNLDEEDRKYLGILMNEHQFHLRTLGVSTQKLDKLIEASLKAGALGAKLTGSGGGGCMFAYAPGNERKVAEAIERAGGKTYFVKPDFGVWQHVNGNYSDKFVRGKINGVD